MNYRRCAIWYLSLEGAGSIVWWAILFGVPTTRHWFLAPGAPDATLLAFGGADFVLFTGAALLTGYGLQRQRRWVWPVLCLHTGAAVYAELYALGLALLSGQGWWGAGLMAPCLFALPYLIWQLRPDAYRDLPTGRP